MNRTIACHPIFDVISPDVDRASFAHLLVTDNTTVIPFVCSFDRCYNLLRSMTAFQRMMCDGWCPNHTGVPDLTRFTLKYVYIFYTFLQAPIQMTRSFRTSTVISPLTSDGARRRVCSTRRRGSCKSRPTFLRSTTPTNPSPHRCAASHDTTRGWRNSRAFRDTCCSVSECGPGATDWSFRVRFECIFKPYDFDPFCYLQVAYVDPANFMSRLVQTEQLMHQMTVVQKQRCVTTVPITNIIILFFCIFFAQSGRIAREIE
jgi:hypothetical protein